MPNFHDIQHKVFFEVQTILDSLSKISSADELLNKQDLFSELSDRVSFLRILDKNKEYYPDDFADYNTDNLVISALNVNDDFAAEVSADEDVLGVDGIEEEVLFTTELNELDEVENTESEASPAEPEIMEEILTESAQDVAYEERVAQKEHEFREMEARRRQIVEINKEHTQHTVPDKEVESEKPQSAERKFKLAHIKGLKAMQNLFDDDPLEKLAHEDQDRPSEPGSLLKSNMSTDYMEAEKKRPEFRLDLNDKVAFTKLLFKGDADELSKTITKLNTFDNIEDARQYLSELYYDKDWKKADEYAQRLWSLVENKFL